MFKFKGIPIAALAMILALASTAASAQAPQSAQATSNLNMRAGPGTQHAVVAWIPKNSWIQVFGCTNPVAWCQTTFNDRHGWVSASHLNPRPAVGTQPLPPPPAPPGGGAHAPAGIPLFGPGFRTPDDQCRRAGATSDRAADAGPAAA